jgi:hypothetical protein
MLLMFADAIVVGSAVEAGRIRAPRGPVPGGGE